MGTKTLERLKEQLKVLGLRKIEEIFQEEADKAIKTKLGYIGYLSKLVEEETLAKTDRSINRRIQTAKFPRTKTLEEFDFSFQPSVDEEKMLKLADLSFIDKKENIILLGPPGVGKTHLAIGLAVKACMARYRVLFQSADEVIAAAIIDRLVHHSHIFNINGRSWRVKDKLEKTGDKNTS